MPDERQLLDAPGRLVFGLLTVASIALVPYMAVTDRVARESERPWMIAGVAVLALALSVIFARDAKAQKKHPPLDADDSTG